MVEDWSWFTTWDHVVYGHGQPFDSEKSRDLLWKILPCSYDWSANSTSSSQSLLGSHEHVGDILILKNLLCYVKVYIIVVSLK